MFISDEDIENLLFVDEINEFLHYISKKEIDKKIIINIILVVFVNTHIESPDWVKEIISLIENDKFNTNMLALTLKYADGIELIFNDFIEKIYVLNDNREINFNDCHVTYDTFNDYLDALYVWFKENFEIS